MQTFDPMGEILIQRKRMRRREELRFASWCLLIFSVVLGVLLWLSWPI